MAKIKKAKGSFKTAIKELERIKSLSGDNKIVSITIKDNGMPDNENPAFYGTIHERGKGFDKTTKRNYKFLKPALKGFFDRFNDEYSEAIIKAVKNKSSGTRRTQKELLDNAEIYGRAGVERVLEYILYETPQYPYRKRKNPSLIETGELFDSIMYTIKNKKGKILRSGQ